jgi:hypothetical protein
MEKTIVVNDSRTVGDITLKLEQVQLSATGMKVSIFDSPAGYSLPQGPSLPPPQFVLQVKGDYSIDGGVPTYTGPAGIRFLDNGVEIVWDNLGPVPKNARQLNFRVTSIESPVPGGAPLTGPWDFRIALQ